MTSDERDTFGPELRRLRVAAGLSLAALAERVHYTKGYLSKVETGQAPPNRPLATLCDAELDTGGRLLRLLPDGTRPGRRRQASGGALSGLPGLTAHFAGRAREEREVRDALARDNPPTPCVCVVNGMGGVGKTELALRVARRLAPRFPDGCLFLDLRGYAGHAPEVSAADALDRFLRLLGVPGEGIPADVDDRAARYRDLLRGKRVLVVLDNAHSARQVLPLLPAEPGCGVLITSRNRLTALDDAHHVSLDTLGAQDAAEVFRSVVGARADGDEDGLVGRIVQRCGLLPLAVRIAAARYRGNPAWTLADLHDRLADEAARLGALDDGERSLAATFHLSYRNLPADQRRMFCLLVLHPGQDVDEYCAAALADTDLGEAARLVGRLHEAHLVIQSAGDRYQFHDLLRAFAVSRAADELAAAERADAVLRLLHLSVDAADRTSALLAPQRFRPEFPLDHLPRATREFADLDAGLRWLGAEWPNLVELCRLAARQGSHEECWRLGYALRDFFFLTKLRDPWIETHTLGLAAARATGDPLAIARMLNCLGLPYRDLGDWDTAAGLYGEALGLFREAGDPLGASTALANLAWIRHHRGDPVGALADLRAALEACRAIGAVRNAAITLRGVALMEAEVGEFEASIEHAREALTEFGELGLDLDAAMAMNCLGWAHYRWGRHADAEGWYRRAIALGERLGSEHEHARAETGLGNLAALAGDWPGARGHWALAREHRDLNPAVIGEERARLTHLAAAPPEAE